jgi:hypothetical protein
LAGLLLATASGAAQEAPQEEGLVAPPSQSEFDSASETSGGGGGGGMGSTLSRGSFLLYGGLRFGYGGNLSVEYENGAEADGDLDGTVGMQLGGEYILHDYFAIGGEFRLAGTKPEGADDRIKLIDFVVRPRGRYVFQNIGLEVYGTLPMGLVGAAPPDPINGGAGFTFGIGWGAIYMFTENIGINAEMSWLKHWFDGDIDLGGFAGGEQDLDMSTSVFNFLVLNAVFVL